MILRYATRVWTIALVGACTQTLDAGHNKAAELCSNRDAGATKCLPTGLLDNLVGYWRLDDGVGSTVAYDSSGRGNEGLLHDLDPKTAWVPGRSDGALAISHGGWVQVAPSASIDSIADRITVTAWVNRESTTGTSDTWGTALSRQVGTTNDQHYHIALFYDGHPTLFISTVNGYKMLAGGDVVAMGVWTHLAGVYDGKIIRLFVNGIEVDSKALTGAFRADTTAVVLGGNGNDSSGIPTELFPGRIDELMLYARALSAAEIGQLAVGSLFRVASADAGLDGSMSGEKLPDDAAR